MVKAAIIAVSIGTSVRSFTASVLQGARKSKSQHIVVDLFVCSYPLVSFWLPSMEDLSQIEDFGIRVAESKHTLGGLPWNVAGYLVL